MDADDPPVHAERTARPEEEVMNTLSGVIA
jgi:hypothetical protein